MPHQLTSAADTSWMFLLRHGATEYNLASPPRLQGRGIDLSLSAEGRQQAAAVGQFLAQFPLSAIYSSPLLRAQETARAIGAHHPGAELTLIPEITEVDVGAWENRSWVDIEREEPELCAAFQRDPAQHGYRDGENLGQVHARVVPTLRQLLQRHLGQTFVVVAHNVVNRCFVADLLALPLARARELSQDNCGVNLIRGRHQEAKLVTMNALFHL